MKINQRRQLNLAIDQSLFRKHKFLPKDGKLKKFWRIAASGLGIILPKGVQKETFRDMCFQDVKGDYKRLSLMGSDILHMFVQV